MIAVDKRGGCLPTYNKVKRVVIQETGFPSSSTGKDSACQCRRPRFDLRVEKIPWRRAWKPTPIFLPGESHGKGAWQTTVHGIAKSQT